MGFLPIPALQGINIADDFLQHSGNSLYGDFRKYIMPYFQVGSEQNPIQLQPVTVTSNKKSK